MLRRFHTLILTGSIALLALAGCQRGDEQPGSRGTTIGKTVSEANLPIRKLDDTSTTLGQFKGKLVLVNFWATWCKPCQTEIPWLIEFNDKYGPQGLVVLGISMDDEGKKVVAPFVKNRRFKVNGNSEPMNYTVLLGNDTIADKFGGLLGLPTSMLYSRDGQKIKTIVGLANYEDLAKAIEGNL